MSAGRYRLAERIEVQAHCLAAHPRHDQGGADGALRADRAEKPDGTCRSSRATVGREPISFHTALYVPCWPTRASSSNQTSNGLPAAWAGRAAATTAGKSF
jgi:hypothetical protein